MTRDWRLLDTGHRPAAENMALDSAMLDARERHGTPSTLRFLQFSEPAVLVGFHQAVADNVRMNYCEENEIDVNRRITGGGSIYVDPPQLGWELVFERREVGSRFDDLNRAVCDAAADGLSRLGVDAEFRPRNDIEIRGRKVCGTGGVYEGDAVLHQGMLLVDFDLEAMFRALRVPVEKLAAKELQSVKERVTSLKEELGCRPEIGEVQEALRRGFEENLDLSFETGELLPAEKRLFDERLPEFRSRDHVERYDGGGAETLHSVYKCEGGLMRASMKVDASRTRVKELLLTGDFLVNPQRTLYDLEAHLKDAPLDGIEERVEEFLEREEPEMVDLKPSDFSRVIGRAAEKADYPDVGIDLEEASDVITVGGDLEDILEEVSVMLLPYCAKPQFCGYRDEIDCAECNECTVGPAYELAEEKGITPVTIQRYEHLEATLSELEERGAGAYLGCCCEAFFTKRNRAFSECSLPGVLIDIESTTCYDLNEQEYAYDGTFEGETDLKTEILKKLVEQIPARKTRTVEMEQLSPRAVLE